MKYHLHKNPRAFSLFGMLFGIFNHFSMKMYLLYAWVLANKTTENL